MQKALFLTIAIGAGLGAAWPSGERATPVQAASVSTSSEPRETVLERSVDGHFYANVEVNGQLVRFLVDTGASGVALTEKDAERVGIAFSPSEYEVVGSGASGPVRGKRIVLDTVTLDGKEARQVPGAILEGSDLSLLGQAWLNRYSVAMRGDRMWIG
jgi:aspartyl protease family protein